MALRQQNIGESLIIYKFDYSSYENFKISLLTINVSCFDWMISIGTDTSNNSGSTLAPSHNDFNGIKWKLVKKSNCIHIYLDLTKYVQNKIFFIKMEINRKMPINQEVIYGSLFQRIYGINYDKYDSNIHDVFELDINIELSPLSLNVLTKPLNLNFNDSKLVIPKVKENSLNFGGLFNDKYRFDVIECNERKNIFLHRISYIADTDAYYENGKTDIKYLKKWDLGVFSHKNLICFTTISKA